METSQELLTKLRQGDGDAWQRLLEDLMPRLLAIGRVELNNVSGPRRKSEELLEDAAQDTWRNLLERTRAGKISRSIEGYAATTMRNAVRKRLWKSKVAQSIPSTKALSQSLGTMIANKEEAERVMKRLRRAMRVLHVEIEEEARTRPRSFSRSPYLQLAFLDLWAHGIRKARDLPPPLRSSASQVTKLKQRSRERLIRVLQRQVDPSVPPSFLDSEVFPQVWSESDGGCFLDRQEPADPAHREDRAIQRRIHLEVVRCPICRAATSPRREDVKLAGRVMAAIDRSRSAED